MNYSEFVSFKQEAENFLITKASQLVPSIPKSRGVCYIF